MKVKTIGIVGAGTMGNGIAQAFAVSGFDVISPLGLNMLQHAVLR